MPGDSMPQWMQDLTAGWPMIRSNLPTFFVILVLITGVIWVVVDWSYRGVLASKIGQIELLDRQIADYKNKLAGLARPDARLLTEDQSRSLIDRLKGGSGSISIVSDMNCSDCGKYAAQLTRIFNDATGWEVSTGVTMGPANVAITGLAVRIADLNNPTSDAQRIIRAFNTNNIRFDLQKLDPRLNPNLKIMLLVTST